MLNGINDKEKKVLDEIMEKIFDVIKVRNWEGAEVARYRKDPQEFARFLRGN